MEGSVNVIPIDPAMEILLDVERDTGVTLNTRQREAVIKVLREEIERRQAAAAAGIKDLVASFKLDGD